MSMENLHTSTPWGVSEDGHIYPRNNVNIPGANPIALVVARYNDDAEPCADNPDQIKQANGRANAAFIIRACNAHKELLAAAQKTLLAFPIDFCQVACTRFR
jgi:hypothetical protein